jgi:hypothetical protein
MQVSRKRTIILWILLGFCVLDHGGTGARVLPEAAISESVSRSGYHFRTGRYERQFDLVGRISSGVGLRAACHLEGVAQQGDDGGQTLFRTAAAAGKIEDQRISAQAGYAAGEPRVLILARAV